MTENAYLIQPLGNLGLRQKIELALLWLLPPIYAQGYWLTTKFRDTVAAKVEQGKEDAGYFALFFLALEVTYHLGIAEGVKTNFLISLMAVAGYAVCIYGMYRGVMVCLWNYKWAMLCTGYMKLKDQDKLPEDAEGQWFYLK